MIQYTWYSPLSISWGFWGSSFVRLLTLMTYRNSEHQTQEKQNNEYNKGLSTIKVLNNKNNYIWTQQRKISKSFNVTPENHQMFYRCGFTDFSQLKCNDILWYLTKNCSLHLVLKHGHQTKRKPNKPAFP